MAIDHIGIRVGDVEASVEFYTTALAPLGYAYRMGGSHGAGLGVGAKPDLWLYPGTPPSDSVHIALAADDRATVDAFHHAAVAAGAVSRGEPGIRSEYHPGYYAAFVTDPDGYNLEVVVHEW